jgi:NADH pyrophosphatase NudC (nudix superfamily)
MKPDKRIYCPYCSLTLQTRPEHDVLRDYCEHCDKFFYDNPLPVVSSIVVNDRKVLLIKRKIEPNKGEWCLPMGFADT